MSTRRTRATGTSTRSTFLLSRKIEESVPRDLVADGCLLCSEDKPHHCHRRLVAEYLREKWGDLGITHLT
jgi:uncharacterized protein (DUF488 family)